MKFFRIIWMVTCLLMLVNCIEGGSMKGANLSNGWLEFKGDESFNVRAGIKANFFLLNWGKDLGWMRYDAQNSSLELHTGFFGFKDGSRDEFSGVNWHIATPDFNTFLMYQGRGVSLFRKPNSSAPEFVIANLKFDEGADWLWANQEFTRAIVPLSRTVRDNDDFELGGTPLALVIIDLIKGTYEISPMDHFADSYLGPEFIIWRHFAKNNIPGQEAKTSRFSATDFKLIEQDLPLVNLLNRYRDSLPDFRRRFFISKQGWAMMGAQSTSSNTGIFLLSPEGKGHILPLFEGSRTPIPNQSLDRCAISSDGQYFVFITDFDQEDFPSAKSSVVHLGRVEKVDGGFMARITRIADFQDLAVSSPIWIPGTHALVLVTDPIDHPSRIRIYDLDKHPVDWSKVPNATPKADIPK